MAVDLTEIREMQGERGSRCTVDQTLGKLQGADLAKLKAALADRSIASTAISRWLTARGHDVRCEPIARHRRGDCRCARS